ncbi:MAG TPA: STAS domain-containing protein [bacterium]|nr:STAS domain-containing protein [bacterium]
MKIKRREEGDVVVLEVSGKVMGGPDSDTFRKLISGLIDEGVKKVLVDLSAVPWMNSSGVGILISAYTSMRNAGASVKFLNINERVKSILMVTKLLTVFESYYSEADALASFKTASAT